MTNAPKTADADYLAVTTTAADIVTDLPNDRQWFVLVTDVACVVAQGSAPTASLADGSTLVPAGVPTYFCGANGATISIRTVSGTGNATISPALYQKAL